MIATLTEGGVLVVVSVVLVDFGQFSKKTLKTTEKVMCSRTRVVFWCNG